MLLAIERVLNDVGPSFKIKCGPVLWQNGIQPVFTAIRQPQGNSAERVNRELGRSFHVYCHEWYNSWPQYIQFSKQSLNHHHHHLSVQD